MCVGCSLACLGDEIILHTAADGGGRRPSRKQLRCISSSNSLYSPLLASPPPTVPIILLQCFPEPSAPTQLDRSGAARSARLEQPGAPHNMAAPTVQIIDGDGAFQEDALKAWVNDTGVADRHANYQVVAIMGPQSSGKSTLLNHVVRDRRASGGPGAGGAGGGGAAARRRGDAARAARAAAGLLPHESAGRARHVAAAAAQPGLPVSSTGRSPPPRPWAAAPAHPASSAAGRARQRHCPPPCAPQFGTTFVEMDAMAGRRQTTKGVWMAK
jgi:hypothetical protein